MNRNYTYSIFQTLPVVINEFIYLFIFRNNAEIFVQILSVIIKPSFK